LARVGHARPGGVTRQVPERSSRASSPWPSPRWLRPIMWGSRACRPGATHPPMSPIGRETRVKPTHAGPGYAPAHAAAVTRRPGDPLCVAAAACPRARRSPADPGLARFVAMNVRLTARSHVRLNRRALRAR
jgi:hypothetical protein